jgi:hypothetical protein
VLEPEGTVELEERWELRATTVPPGDELEMAAQLATPLLGVASPDDRARRVA